MRFVIYNRHTSRIYQHPRTRKEYYDTIRAAKAARTRLERDGKIDATDYDIADVSTYTRDIEQFKTVKNLMSGKPVRVSVNTPACCDPSTETYWSM